MVTTRKDKLVKLLTTLLVAALALLFISPLLWMVSTSLKRNSEVFAQPFHWIPEDPSLSNYAEVWFEEGVNMLHAYRNSFIIVFFSVTGSLIIASLAAYAFAKINFKGKNAIFMLFLSSMMIPSQTTLVPRFMLFKTMGLYNSLWAIILPGLFSATAIFMLRQFYMGLPNDLMEAAKIDGAGHLGAKVVTLSGPDGYIYDPEQGDTKGGVAPGTPFESLPADWVCPLCRMGREMFKPAP